METHVKDQMPRTQMVEQFINEHFYDNLHALINTTKKPNSYTRYPFGSKEDREGKDVVETFVDKEGISERAIDEKSQNAFWGNATDSFAFELIQNVSYPFSETKENYSAPGWFLDKKKKNDYYRIIWVNNCGGKKDKRKDKIKYEDIVSINFYTFSKENFINMLREFGVEVDVLGIMAESCYSEYLRTGKTRFYPFRKAKNNKGKYLIYLCVSDLNMGNGVFSTPINLVVKKELFDKIQDNEYCVLMNEI